jgi:large subunit ribosomal protein L17
VRHRVARTRLKRSTSQRKALLEGLVKNLIIHQRIQTTHPRAKQAQRLADKLITLGKTDSVHSRRQAFAILQDRTMTKRLFTELAPLFADRPGGYTRVLHMNPRKGDAAPMALLEFVEKTDEFSKLIARKAETKEKKQALLEAEAKKNAPAPEPDHDHSHEEDIAPKSAAPEKITKKTKQIVSEVVEAPKKAEAEPAKEDPKDKENFVGNLKKFFKRKGQE